MKIVKQILELKSVALILAILLAISVFIPSLSFAAIACRPGLGNCPKEPEPGGRPMPIPSRKTSTLSIGYFEIPSPDCNQTDMQNAKIGAETKALEDAQSILGSTHLNQTSSFKYLTLVCRQSLYAGSAHGLSWIVQTSAHFSL